MAPGPAPRTIRVLVLERGTSLQRELLAIARGTHFTARPLPLVAAPLAGDACDVCLLDAETYAVADARRETHPRRYPIIAAARDPEALAAALERGADLHVRRPLSEVLVRELLLKAATELRPRNVLGLCDDGRALSTPRGARVPLTPLSRAIVSLLLQATAPVPVAIVAREAFGRRAGSFANVERKMRRLAADLRPHGIELACAGRAYELREVLADA